MSRSCHWLLVCLVAFAAILPIAPAWAQDDTPISGDTIFRDSADTFSVPIPTNWTIATQSQFSELHSPDGDLVVYIVVLEAAAVADASKASLALIDAPLAADALPDSTQPAPSAAGVDETVVLTFVTGGGKSFVQVYGQRIGQTVYSVIFVGTIDAATKRASQVQQIASGFTIASLVKIDLSNASVRELTPALLAEFEAYVSALVMKLKVPGASVAIVIGDEVVYAQGFGVKVIGGSDPVTADTRMMIGSTTKSMTTMMMATEVDDGLMSWDEPVIDILPGFAVADAELSRTLTMRNLVCACTGVPRRDLEFLFNANDLSASDVIASLADFEFYTAFGEAFQYSNQMVATGGYAAAAAARGDDSDLMASYAAELQRRVFDPIGMGRTTISFETVASDPDYATPHGANLAAQYVPLPMSYEQMLVPVAPAGLVWSTANDMGRYLITEIGRGVGPNGNRVVSTKNLEETWVPQVAVDGETSYGLGWLIGLYKGLRLIDHGGNTFGFTSDLAFLPDERIGIATLSNAQGSNLFNEAVRTYLFELLYGLQHEVDAQIDFFLSESEKNYAMVMAQIEDVPADIAKSAIGMYRSDALGDLQLSIVDGVLTMDTGEFHSRLVMQKATATDRTAVLVAADPPIPGTPFTLSVDDFGVRRLVLVFGTETYTFEQTDEAATPIATPVSS